MVFAPTITAEQHAKLDLEMAFAHQHHTSYTCSDIYDPTRECKRAAGHVERDDIGHAAGYGKGRVFW